MKTKKIELDVDFIGGQTSLTKEEELAISEFIKKNKTMETVLTIVLLAAGLGCFWLFYKSIDFFENI